MQYLLPLREGRRLRGTTRLPLLLVLNIVLMPLIACGVLAIDRVLLSHTYIYSICKMLYADVTLVLYLSCLFLSLIG